jgi:Zn-dependent protease
LPELTPERIAMGLTTYVVLLFSISVHESAHAWMAHKLGDDTALHEGRITLNPIPHIDPMGTLMLPLMQLLFTGSLFFGWAKPTPYNPQNFRRDITMRRGHMLVAGAGPVSNIILALLFVIPFVAVFQLGVVDSYRHPVAQTLFLAIAMNVSLAVFNLFPIPPLDGSKVASYGLPGGMGDRYDRVMEPYGFLILMVAVVTGVFRFVITPIMEWVAALLTALIR